MIRTMLGAILLVVVLGQVAHTFEEGYEDRNTCAAKRFEYATRLTACNAGVMRFEKRNALFPESAYGVIEALRLCEAYVARARLYRDNSRPEEAMNDLDKAVALRVGSIDALDERASLAMELGQLGKAKKDLDKSLAMRADFFQVHLLLGQYFELTGEKDKAVAEYETVLRLYSPHELASDRLQKLKHQ